jgi:trehalose 6-phosphate phosphatase
MPDLSPPDLPPPPADLAGVALYLDFDGTLVDLAPRPDAVEVSAGLLDRLDHLAALMPGRVAIVSGRSIAQLDAMLGAHATRVSVAGSHGAERRLAGADALAPEMPASLEQAALALETYADAEALVFERKSLGAALHYRQRPEAEADAVATAAAVAAEHGLTLQRGKMMAEVRAPGDKGAAVRALAAEPEAAGTRPLFFGDDVTDEDGFEAAAALGGAGVLVGPPRDTAARYRLDGPAALLAWLDRATGAAA